MVPLGNREKLDMDIPGISQPNGGPTVDGRNAFRTTLTPAKTKTFVGIYRSIIIPGFLGWCGFGYGSKLNHQGTAGLSPYFHLPGQPILGTYF